MKYLRLFLSFIVLFLIITTISAFAADIPEHSFIRPFPGSVLAENMSKYTNFDSYKFYVTNEQTQKREEVEIKGKKWQLLYEVRTPSGERVRNISKLEFFENYKAAALERGGKVVFEDQGQMVLTIPREDGGITWCRVSGNAGLGQQELVIIDEEGFKKSLTFGPVELKEALDSEGRVILYDILFDYDKATLKQESDKQLQYIVTLLLQNPELKVEIQGHTDDEGEEAYNLTLSDKRANTVLQYLQLFGIGSERLLSKGYGESQPVATNDTEEGRAKNRRVELVKM
ncbi:MAG: OmpA family protein [Candidatus Caldatribacteriota bacterium]|jgi:outer membrane protein OmpA-like peptidoglycan-associated protein|nr:OmpA family protein [Atribacterota bacterium]MDD3641232.1 OmpA family protein [Atribacterota bacterium]MDD4289256.1 OmpA family protein [Atribacterota bacterium]